MGASYYEIFSSPKQKMQGRVVFNNDVAFDTKIQLPLIDEVGAVRTQNVICVSLADGTQNTGWTEETNGSFDVGSLGEGPTELNGAMSLTQTDADCDKQIYKTWSAGSELDLSACDYIGYWYKGADDDVFTANDIRLLLFDGSNTTYATAFESHDAVGTFTEESTAVWKYKEIALSTDSDDIARRKYIRRVAFYSDAGTDAQVLSVHNIEAYKYGYGNGPAYGTIKRFQVANATTIDRGTFCTITSANRIEPVADNDYSYQGIAVTTATTGDEKGTVTVDLLIDGIVNMYSLEILTAGDGVAIAGTTNVVDDGGASSEKLQIGTAMVTCIANDVVPILTGRYGYVGTVGT